MSLMTGDKYEEDFRRRMMASQPHKQRLSVDALMDVLAQKFATQSSSVRRAFRAVAAPGQDRIGVEQVRRLLRNLNLGVGPKLARKLFARLDKDNGGDISYEEFRSAFGEHISGTAYEHSLQSVGTLQISRKPIVGKKNLSLEECIAILKERMATQHTKVRKAFRLLDQDHSGFLDKNEFHRMLHVYNIDVSEENLNALLHTISGTTENHKISYAQFNTFFGGAIAGESFRNAATMETSILNQEDQQKNKSKKILAPRPRTWTTKDFLATLEAVLMSRSKTVRRIFRMVDSDQSGQIDEDEWHSALNRLNIEMSKDDATKFFRLFANVTSGGLSYEDFLNNFGSMIAGYKDTGILTMQAMANKDLEERKQFSQMIDARQKLPRLPEHSVEQIKDLIARRLGNKYSSGRAAFREIDKSHTGSLTYAEFRQFLANRNIELRESDLDKFIKEVDLDNDGEINYDEFLRSFGDAICGAPWESIKTGLITDSTLPTACHLPRATLSPKEALNLLHAKLAMSTKSVTRIFKRFNKDRLGYLTPLQFEFLFHNFNLTVDVSVVEAVLSIIHTKHGRNLDADKRLDYALFCAEFGPTISGESYQGVMDPMAKLRSIRQPGKAPYTDADTALKMLCNKLRTNFTHNRVAFTRFNTLRDGELDMAELRRALENYHINMTDDDFKKFVTRFDKSRRGAVNFKEFLENVGQEVSGTCDTGLSFALQARDDKAREKRRLFEADFQDFLIDEDADEEDILSQPEEPETTTIEAPLKKRPQTVRPKKTQLTLFDPATRRSLHRAVNLANAEASRTKKLVHRKPTAARRHIDALQFRSESPSSTEWQLATQQRKKHTSFQRRPATAHTTTSTSAGPRIVTHNLHARL